MVTPCLMKWSTLGHVQYTLDGWRLFLNGLKQLLGMTKICVSFFSGTFPPSCRSTGARNGWIPRRRAWDFPDLTRSRRRFPADNRLLFTSNTSGCLFFFLKKIKARAHAPSDYSSFRVGADVGPRAFLTITTRSGGRHSPQKADRISSEDGSDTSKTAIPEPPPK